MLAKIRQRQSHDCSQNSIMSNSFQFRRDESRDETMQHRLNVVDSRWRPRQMRGDMRTEPPPQSVLKHSEATNGAEHVGAFRSVALPCGVATVTTRRNRHEDTTQSTEDCDQDANEMEAMVESAPVEVGDPLVAYSTHNDALAVPSANGTTSDNESNDDRVVGADQNSPFKRRLIVWIAMVSVFLGLAGLGSGVALAL